LAFANFLDNGQTQHNIAFYEDLPYASRSKAREQRLAEIGPKLAKAGFRRITRAFNTHEKLKLVTCYSSQLGQKWHMDDFAVADAANASCEAWWLCDYAERNVSCRRPF